jgi:hypothetical protein
LADHARDSSSLAGSARSVVGRCLVKLFDAVRAMKLPHKSSFSTVVASALPRAQYGCTVPLRQRLARASASSARGACAQRCSTRRA